MNLRKMAKNLKLNYAWAIDLQDWDGLRRVLHDPVLVDFSGLGYDGRPRSLHPDELIAQVRQLRDAVTTCHHELSAWEADEVTDGLLSLRCKVESTLTLDSPLRSLSLVSTGAYDDLLLRDERGAWKISAITRTTLAEHGDKDLRSVAAERSADSM